MSSSLEQHVARVRPVNRGMAHRAGLILLRQVVRGPDWTLCRNGVALQTEQTGLADPQQARIRSAVCRMTTGAAFRFHRQMFKDEGSLLVGVALRADGVAAGNTAGVAKRACAMQIVAVGALHEAFIHAVMKGLGEVGLGGRVAAVNTVPAGPW